MSVINPYFALVVFVFLLLIIAIIFWPNVGVLHRYRRFRSNTKRALMEDALKHIYDYEIHELNSTLNSVAGNLGISLDRSSKIVENLKRLNLVGFNDQVLSLTKSGREYALRIIRIHRLWENYLAEETGIKESDWHDEAEKVEHLLSKEDADLLSAKMNNPKFDPHGDPIPSTDGSIVSHKGQLLNTLEKDDIAKIIHIEDEPKSIYTRLLEDGLYPGKQIKVIEKNTDEIKIAYDGIEKSLTQINASKLSVDIITGKTFENKKIRTLADINYGETAEVVSLLPNCRGHQRRRLLDFGIVPGSKISVHMDSPLKDPTAYLVKETIVALRKNQAEKVIIKN